MQVAVRAIGVLLMTALVLSGCAMPGVAQPTSIATITSPQKSVEGDVASATMTARPPTPTVEPPTPEPTATDIPISITVNPAASPATLKWKRAYPGNPFAGGNGML